MKRTTLLTYLRKAQKLQIVAVNAGLESDVQIYFNDDGPWVQGYVGYSLASFTKDQEGDRFVFFYLYNWQTTEKWDEELARVEGWINEQINK